MPKNYSTRELRNILESTNKKFSSFIKTNTEISEKYVQTAEAYQHLINLIDRDKSTNTIRQLYKLEAQLGLIQSKLNSISLVPADETEFCMNDKQLEEFEKQLNTLTKTTIQFKEKLPKNKAGLEIDYGIFLSQLNAYKASWSTYYYNIKASYYYNYAAVLVEKVTEKNIKSFDSCTRMLEKAVFLFEKSAYFYEKNEKIQEKIETDRETSKTKATLKSFKQKSTPSGLKTTPHSRKAMEKINLHTEPTSMLSTSNAVSSLPNVKTIKTDETLPFKKRKYIIETTTAFNTKKLAQSNQIDKNLMTVPIQIVKPVSKKVESESFRDENFEEIEFILKNTHSTDFTIYLELIFEFAKFIKLDNNDINNIFRHNLLTKLYLLDTLLHLLNLLYCENKESTFIRLKHQVLDVLNDLNTHYPIQQGWKFFYLEELKKTMLDKNGLRQLLLMEIKNYIWGIETISKDLKLSYNLLHNISTLIRHSFSTPKYIVEDTVEHALFYLKNIREEEQVFFYSRLSREIVKFYLAPENKNWAEINKIPLNNPLFLEELLNWLSLAKKLALILNDYCFIEKIVFLKKNIVQKIPNQTTSKSTQYFFNLPMLEINAEKELMESAKTLFNKQFKLHIERFYQVYGIPWTMLADIYNSLILFIEKQVEIFNSETTSANNYTFLAKR